MYSSRILRFSEIIVSSVACPDQLYDVAISGYMFAASVAAINS